MTEQQEEIAETKKKYRRVNHNISQLKEEIDQKEAALTKEHMDHKKKEKTIQEQASTVRR